MENTELFRFRLNKTEKANMLIIFLITIPLSVGLVWLSFYGDYVMAEVGNGILIKFFIENLNLVGGYLFLFCFGFVYLRKNAKIIILIPFGVYILIVLSPANAVGIMQKNHNFFYDGPGLSRYDKLKNLPLLSANNLVGYTSSITSDGCPSCMSWKKAVHDMNTSRTKVISDVVERAKEMRSNKYKKPYWE